HGQHPTQRQTGIAVLIPALQTILAFSSTLSTRHALVLDSLRVATISTRSPSLHSLASSCAWYFADFVTILPYSACLTRRSTSTVTVLSILSLTTRPTSVAISALRAGALVASSGFVVSLFIVTAG